MVFDWWWKVINLQRTKVYVFSDSVLCLGKNFENLNRMSTKWTRMLGECQTRFSACTKTWNWTMVIYWFLFWLEFVFHQWIQSTRKMGQNGGKDVVGIRRKLTSHFPCYKSIVQRSAQKQWPWKFVAALLCRFPNDWDFFHWFCKSAQPLRSSRRNVWRMRNFSR